LIKVLGSHSISPHEMKAIFKLMNGENITFSVRDFSLLLDIMQHINGASVVSNFFDFSGQDSVRYHGPYMRIQPANQPTNQSIA